MPIRRRRNSGESVLGSEIRGYANTYLSRWVDSAYANLARKKASGKYNKTLAAKLMRIGADRAAKAYFKEYYTGEPQSAWSREISVAARNEAARYMVEDFEEYWADGALDQYIPKKYQGKVKNPLTVSPRSRTKQTGWIPVKAVKFEKGRVLLRTSKTVARSLRAGERLGNPWEGKIKSGPLKGSQARVMGEIDDYTGRVKVKLLSGPFKGQSGTVYKSELGKNISKKANQ